MKIKFNFITFLEYTGSAGGLIGATLLAMNASYSPLGWRFFLLANIAMLIFSFSISRYALFVQYLGFTATSILGIIRSIN